MRQLRIRQFAARTGLSDKASLRSMYSMTWPPLCTLITYCILGFTDVWVAGVLGTDVQASIGLITQCHVMLMIVCWSMDSGAIASVSQSLGANRIVRARRYVAATIWMMLCAALIQTFLGIAFQDAIIAGLGTPPSMHEAASVFLCAAMWALPGHYGMTVATALLRSSKSVMPALYVGILVCVLNVIGDFGFGLGWFGFPAFGPGGIAWSTTASAFIGAICLLSYLKHTCLWEPTISLPRRWLSVALRYLFSVSIPACGTSLLWNTGYLLIFMITAALPEHSVAALAGMTAGLRIESILFMPANAGNMTAAVLVGHALGRRDYQGAMRIALSIVLTLCTAMTAFGVIFWFFRDFFAELMSSDIETQRAIVSYLTYNILAIPFTVGTVTLAGVFNGAGASVYPMRAFFLSIWCVRLPVAAVLGLYFWGYEGVFFSMLISQMVQFSFVLWALLKCNWSRYSMRAKRA